MDDFFSEEFEIPDIGEVRATFRRFGFFGGGSHTVIDDIRRIGPGDLTPEQHATARAAIEGWLREQ